jgi:hypothetical protein
MCSDRHPKIPSCIGLLDWLPIQLYWPRTSEASRDGAEEQWGTLREADSSPTVPLQVLESVRMSAGS